MTLSRFKHVQLPALSAFPMTSKECVSTMYKENLLQNHSTGQYLYWKLNISWWGITKRYYFVMTHLGE